jgi:CheY-like chemotaxis protein
VPADEKRKKVLVADDDSDMVIFLCTLLHTHGFDSIVARNAAEGLKKAAEENPDCIILNAMMSDESGIDLYICIKQDRLLKKIPVIMLSAIGSKTFFQYLSRSHAGVWKQKNTHSGPGVPEPEVYLESPPESNELIHQLRILTRGSGFGVRGSG